jgi:hypothetical protein
MSEFTPIINSIHSIDLASFVNSLHLLSIKTTLEMEMEITLKMEMEKF